MGRPTRLDEEATPNAILAEEGRAALTKSNPEAPTLDDVRALRDHLQRFLNKSRSSFQVTWMDEDDFLPSFSCVADALRPLRSVPEEVEGWPHRICRALPIIAEQFDAVTRAWGWQRVAEPEPSRSAYVTERRAWFASEVARPVFEAARSWQAGCRGLDLPPDVDQWGDEGRRLGYKPTLTPDEGQVRYRPARERWECAPRFGACCPMLEAEAYDRFCLAFNQLDSALKSIAIGTSSGPEAIATPPPNEPDSRSTGDGTEVIVSSIQPEAVGTVTQRSSLDEGRVDPVRSTNRKRAKRPTHAEFNTYKILIIRGKQTEAAKATGLSQSEVSKRFNLVKLWLSDGNALPEEYA